MKLKRVMGGCVFPVLLLAAPLDDFVLKVKTDNPGVTTSSEFQIPIVTTNGTGYNVDCNDDGIDEVTGATTTLYPDGYTCTYPSAGSYTIRIKDNKGDRRGFCRIVFGAGTDAQKLLDIKQWGTAIWSSMSGAFRDANNTTVSATDIPDLSSVGSLSSMFRNCTLADPDTSGWDISNITNLSYMFRDAISANPDVGNWNTSNVTNFSGLFYNAVNATPVTTTNGNIWNTGSATKMSSMFRGATVANPDTSGWNVSNVTTMAYMFRDTNNSNPDVSSWATLNVTEMQGMFYNAIAATPNTSGWNTSSVIRMDDMFRGAAAANPDTSGWNTSNVAEMDGMFRDSPNANPDTSSWNTSNVTKMNGMFRNTQNAAPDTSNWNTAQVTTMGYMFSQAHNAQPITTGWNTGSVTDMRGMFQGTVVANPDVANWDTSNVTTMANMFQSTLSANPDVSSWDTSQVTNMQAMFNNAVAAYPDVSGWDVSQVTDMLSMFQNVPGNPDVSAWTTSSLVNVSRMFKYANNFNRDLSGWDASHITTAVNFLLKTQMSQLNYDALLISWSQQNLQSNVSFNAGKAQYCQGEQARSDIINNYGWIIKDGGKNCGQPCGSVSGTLTAYRWKTISFDCDTGSNGIAALLGGSIDTNGSNGNYGDNANWVVYEQRGDYSGSSNSMVMLAPNDTVEPGKGYWIIADHNTTFHVDTTLGGLGFTPSQKASNVGISDPDFAYVHLRNLPDSDAVELKVLLGNPFPNDFNLSDMYFSHAGSTYAPWDDNTSNGNYVNEVLYTYDYAGNDLNAYEAISTTPGFNHLVPALQGFWIRLKPGQNGGNTLAYPLSL